MTLTVRFFAGCREAVGLEQARVSLPDPATVEDLRRALAEQFPRLSRYVDRVRYSVNWEYVPSDAPLQDGDEVAMIPPVAGGGPKGR